MIKEHCKKSQSSIATIFRVIRQYSYTKLFKKYTSGNFSYHKILANNLIFNDSCRIVARFKDYLIFDDNTEFLRRFYTEEESNPRLNRILTFYETYSKIFPNYMILKESKYLYRNIRKKQKMIDAVNEIKREEEENRKRMKKNNGKITKDDNELFTKTVKEEIKTFQENTTFEKHRNQFDSENEDGNESSISISIVNRKMFFENKENKLNSGSINRLDSIGDKTNSIHESFITNETNHSISGILNVLNDNKIYIKDLPKLLEINNYSKNSQKLKNQKKTNKNECKKNSAEKKNLKNIQLFSSTNKLDKNNKKNKKNETLSRQKQLSKNISNSTNINGNYLSSKTFKKLSNPSTSIGSVFIANTEKNINEINQFQNIIIPKGNTVININNNYFEQIASSTLPMGYYTNQNFKLKTNSNITNNNNSTFKKSKTNQHCKSSKNNLIHMTEKKTKLLKSSNSVNKETKEKNISIKHHCKQISQDYIYQKNKHLELTKVNKNEKCLTNNDKDDKIIIREKIIKFGSLSPQPTIVHVDGYQEEKKKIQEENILKNSKKYTYKNYYTENNDPNLITGNTKWNEEEDDNKEREKLLLHIRDLIENKKKDNNKIGNRYNKTKNNKLRSKNFDIENNFNLSNISKYKTINNFNKENQSSTNILKKSENICMTNENLISKKKLENTNNDKICKNEEINKKQKIKRSMGFKKISIKEKKNRTKGFLKNSNVNNTYNTSTKMAKDKSKNFYRKNNDNYMDNKNLFNSSNLESILKSTEFINNRINKKSKLLNKRNEYLIKTNKSEIEFPIEKGVPILSQSLLYKSANSQLTNLLMSHKKEDLYTSESNTTAKIYQKGKIQNLKYNKKNYKEEFKEDLNFEVMYQSMKINSSLNGNSINNYYNDNLSHKILFTEYNNTNNYINLNNITHNKRKTLTKTHNMNNSDIKNKYKSLLLKKNKQKSCELNKQSNIQQKINQELIERMNFIKHNNKNNFYQNYKENKFKLNKIKRYIGKNIGSFDNLSGSNINNLGNTQNFARNSLNFEHSTFQTPSTGNKKLGLYKKVISKKPKLLRENKKVFEKKVKNFATPGAIKVNRSKFLEKVKDKFFENNKMNTMINFNSCYSHKNL